MPELEKGYRGVSFMAPLINDVEALIKAHPELGYKTVADFVNEAVRLRI